MALCLDGRRGSDGRSRREAVPRRPVEHRHDRADRLVPVSRPAVAHHRLFRSPSSEARRVAMTRNLTAACVLLASSSAFGAAPTLQDYAQGIDISAPESLPLVEATLPDAVYQGATSADLTDVRGLNADGLPVPHAFCAEPATTEPTVTEEQLPVFELHDAATNASDGARVELQTGGGMQLNLVVEPEPGQPAVANGRIHIIDAHAQEVPVRAIKFDWQSPDGASQAQVRIEASDDLD